MPKNHIRITQFSQFLLQHVNVMAKPKSVITKVVDVIAQPKELLEKNVNDAILSITIMEIQSLIHATVSIPRLLETLIDTLL